MAINKENFLSICKELDDRKVALVAVSKTKSVEDIQHLYDLGHRDFGENYVQELVDKSTNLPGDIRWHFIGHLQTNKVKYIAPFVYLIHGVESFKLLQEINKQAAKNNRVIDALLQVHIADEETKFGLDEQELKDLINNDANSLMKNIRIVGLMGMASFSTDMNQVRTEFRKLKNIFNTLQLPARGSELLISNSPVPILSMGMSGDYKIAIEEGSTMVRIGSLLFGAR
ncbi:MAG: YggS family pyridoxal phosphate-dependent enzyme [Chitinophagaceae bacterium]